jgi:hypothetical protein
MIPGITARVIASWTCTSTRARGAADTTPAPNAARCLAAPPAAHFPPIEPLDLRVFASREANVTPLSLKAVKASPHPGIGSSFTLGDVHSRRRVADQLVAVFGKDATKQ